MATPPDFSPGQVLTAAHMDAVGLWLVKSQTVGSGVVSVTVTGAFNADFDNYFIVFAGGTQSTASESSLKLGASTTGYYGVLNYGIVGGGALFASDNNAAKFTWVGGGSAGQNAHLSCFLYSPYLATHTKIRQGAYQSNVAFGIYNGDHRVASSYTDFTITSGTGTFTGGTIRVYGYRN
jgi:hypothetical protein